ncbi:MAG: hypothetical protein EXS08_08985 [Planctomycetes bacterium]|nr:hypothetical protein [Planctomycetota bacterium]
MKRAHVGWILCAALLFGGMFTAALSSANRARGNELDRLERWCEAQARRNELTRTANQCREWQLLGATSARVRERRVAP